MSLTVQQDTMENSSFCNGANTLKNCYLTFNIAEAVETYYSEALNNVFNSMDIFYSYYIELSYEIVNSKDVYHSFYCLDCSNINDCYFCFNCNGCTNCFGCTNLNNQKYYWFDEQLTPEEYQKKFRALNLGDVEERNKWLSKAKKAWSEAIVKYIHTANSEDCSGDYIYNCKNVKNSYSMNGCENCSYCAYLNLPTIKDTYDVCYWGSDIENCYECCVIGASAYNLKFCQECWPGCSDLEYCAECRSCSNCFACVGLKKKKFCIFNKQYSEDEYKKLVIKLKNKMRNTGEYGQFFPGKLSRIAYNESVATELYPLKKEEALKLGFRWTDNLPYTSGKETKKWEEIPADIEKIDDNIIKETLVCTGCQRNYKIIAQELAFYKKESIPLPRKCSNCRHVDRLALKQPNKIYHGKCMKTGCNNEFETSFPPDTSHQVYCAECYQKEVY